MDTSQQVAVTLRDKQATVMSQRQRRSIAEKRRIVEETLAIERQIEQLELRLEELESNRSEEEATPEPTSCRGIVKTRDGGRGGPHPVLFAFASPSTFLLLLYLVN